MVTNITWDCYFIPGTNRHLNHDKIVGLLTDYVYMHIIPLLSGIRQNSEVHTGHINSIFRLDILNVGFRMIGILGFLRQFATHCLLPVYVQLSVLLWSHCAQTKLPIV